MNLKFKEAFRQFAIIILNRRFEDGTFDKTIESFVEGDSLTINLNIDMVGNDIIIMRILAGEEITEEVMQKVKKHWRKEEIDATFDAMTKLGKTLEGRLPSH
jgi:hypothetical protein